MASKAGLGLTRSDQVADPKLPIPEPRGLRFGERIFHALVVHGNLPRSCAVTGAEPQSSIFHLVTNRFLPRTSTAGDPRAACDLTPQARPNSLAGPAEKHCAAQAEYGRLAAQAYSPSDAMSQARFCLDGMKKVQRAGANLPGNWPAETRRYGGRIILADVMPAAAGTDMNAGRHALRFRGHAHLNLVGAHLFLARWIRLPRRHMRS